MGYSPFLPHQECLSLQNPIQHLHNTHKLLIISLLGTRDILPVELSEPRRLAVVRTLTGHLEVQVLLDVVLFGKTGNVELVLLVVRVDQVLENGAGFP